MPIRGPNKIPVEPIIDRNPKNILLWLLSPKNNFNAKNISGMIIPAHNSIIAREKINMNMLFYINAMIIVKETHR